jgi:hypothetical protein
MWLHAERLLAQDAASDFVRADALSTLKRAVNQRLKALEATYCFAEVSPLKVKGTLSQLEGFGFIRTRLLRELMKIRNLVEHEDSPPPSQERCNEFLEFVWYFLRTTERHLTNVPLGLSYQDQRNPRHRSTTVEIAFSPELVISVSGWLSAADIRYRPFNDWGEVVLERHVTRRQLLEELDEKERKADLAFGGRGLKPSDHFVNGRLISPTATRDYILENYYLTAARF